MCVNFSDGVVFAVASSFYKLCGAHRGDCGRLFQDAYYEAGQNVEEEMSAINLFMYILYFLTFFFTFLGINYPI